VGALSRAHRKLREVGLLYSLQILVARALPAGWFRAGGLAVLAFDPAAAPLAGRPMRGGGELRWAGPREHELLGRFGHSRATLEARLGRGDRAYVMLEGDELLGYVWFRGGLYDDDGLGIRFRMEPGEVWLYDAMVARGRRGRGLYATLLRAAAAALGNEGLARIWVAVESANRNSLEAHLRAGAEPLHTLHLVRALGVTWIVHASAPGIHRLWLGRWPEIPSSALRAPAAAPSAAPR
jgi:ribosomal protein S18 acetylase RimI-like enzyme